METILRDHSICNEMPLSMRIRVTLSNPLPVVLPAFLYTPPGTLSRRDECPAVNFGRCEMADATKTSEGKDIVALVKREWHLAPRALIASIPMVGHAISVVIEDQIVRRQHERLDQFAQQLAQKLEKNEAALDQISNDLFLFATKKVADQTEVWKPRTIANILTAKKDNNELLFKYLLIDHTSQLTDFDLAIFWDISGANQEHFPPETRYEILKLQAHRPEIKLLRDISERKLVQLGFLRRRSDGNVQSFEITDIGAALIEVI
jgi:hypothetical protein